MIIKTVLYWCVILVSLMAARLQYVTDRYGPEGSQSFNRAENLFAHFSVMSPVLFLGTVSFNVLANIAVRIRPPKRKNSLFVCLYNDELITESVNFFQKVILYSQWNKKSYSIVWFSKCQWQNHGTHGSAKRLVNRHWKLISIYRHYYTVDHPVLWRPSGFHRLGQIS